MAGFSETSLLRDRNFSAACPKDCPPVYSLALPTDVQAMSIKYLKPYFNSWVEGELLPPSFTVDCLAMAPENTDYLVPLAKESVIFFDGDGGEVRGCPEMLTTHRQSGVEVMRFRTTFNDAPEAFTAFRFYRKSVDGRLTTLHTRHVGIESLRAARKTISTCVQVSLQLGCNLSPPDIDRYGRRMVNLWIQAESEGPLTAFPVIMAHQGFTHEFPMSSEQNVHNAVKVATATMSGLRNLPPECLRYPYRPWDVRKLWSNPEVYSSEFQIQSDVSASQETGVAETEAGGECYCKLISSHLVAESYCYPATSTIPGAGRGLFIRPRNCAILKDSHLCLYAQNASSEQEIDDSGSSRVYAIQIGNRKWFDGEIDTGENIGRFANQSHLRETLELAVEQADKQAFSYMDWNAVNNYARGKANSHYHYVPREQQLVIRSSQEFPPSSTPIEIFTCYADLQLYWLPLISSKPHLFPPELVRPVQFLLTSELSNLTEAEKDACSG